MYWFQIKKILIQKYILLFIFFFSVVECIHFDLRFRVELSMRERPIFNVIYILFHCTNTYIKTLIRIKYNMSIQILKYSLKFQCYNKIATNEQVNEINDIVLLRLNSLTEVYH